MQMFNYGFLVEGSKGLFFASDHHLYFPTGVVTLKKVLLQI